MLRNWKFETSSYPEENASDVKLFLILDPAAKSQGQLNASILDLQTIEVFFETEEKNYFNRLQI